MRPINSLCCVAALCFLVRASCEVQGLGASMLNALDKVSVESVSDTGCLEKFKHFVLQLSVHDRWAVDGEFWS